MTGLRLALAQYPIEKLRGLEDFEAKLDDLLGAAKRDRADLLVLPEYAAMELAAAFTREADAVSERDAIVARADVIVEVMRETARRHRLWLLGGSLPMPRDGAVRNRAPLISSQGRVVFQEKRVMTRFETEEWQVSAGEEPAVFETPWGRVGIAICYDVEFPMLVRAQVEAGAWLILAPSCTDTLWGFNRVRLSARARAIENQCFVAVVPTVGDAPWSATLDRNRGFAGVFGPCDRGFPEDGVIALGRMDEPGLVFAELDPGVLEAVRREGGVRKPSRLAGASGGLPRRHAGMSGAPPALIYIVAGEASGDVLGARLMRAMRAQRGGLSFAGIGGARMAEEGLETLFPMHELALMGLAEVLPKIRALKRRMDETVADIAARRPAVVVTIDSPGFALRLLRRIAPLGLPRVHYVAPQVWAWRENRVKTYPGLWDRLLCLLPFEPAFFAGHGLAAEFVGHPVLESGAETGNAARFRAAHGVAAEAIPIILMPGSRETEITRLLPIFAEALHRLEARFPRLVPVMPVAASVAPRVTAAVSSWAHKPILVTDVEGKHDAFAAARFALTKSGTSTLELALAGVPMVVAYRVNPITAAIVRRVVKVSYAAMVNLLAGREVVPELIQERCTPERLAGEVARLIENDDAANAQRAAFAAVMQSLRPPQGLPSDAAAAAVLGLLPK